MASGYIIDVAGSSAGHNYAKNATITATGMNDANLAKLVNGTQSIPAQFTSNSGNILNIDLGSTYAIDCISLLGHTLTSSSVVKVYASTTSDYASTPVDVTLTYNQYQNVYTWSTNQSYRYWRVTVTDTSNTSYPMIGELVIGEVYFFSHPQSWGHSEKHVHSVMTQETDYGVVHKYYLNYRRVFESVSFKQRPDAEAVELISMFNECRGSMIPILMLLDSANPNDAIYGRLGDEMSQGRQFIGWNDIEALTISEDPHAKVLLTS